MAETFFEPPILNSPYEVPTRHHDLDEDGQPTNRPPVHGRRRSALITPVPKPRKRKRRPEKGAGKTTVMAMLIAWQTLNAVRHPGSKTFSRGFLIVTPGITIRDRLRVLLPNDPESYYRYRELVPADMLPDMDKAKIVITNYHAFKLRERVQISKIGRALLKGRGAELNTLETEGQMLQRVMPELMSMKGIVVLNDEAHHCYREKVEADDAESLKGEDRDEAKKNNEAARLWISGIEIVKKKLGLNAVYDLSRPRSSCAAQAMPRARCFPGPSPTFR